MRNSSQTHKNLDGKQVADDQNGKHAALVGKLVVDLYSK